MKKSLLVVVGLAAFVAMSFSYTNNAPRYKNLKVLPRNISKEDLDTVMKHFTVALGVKCNFCHIRNEENTGFDFASDNNNHKKIARDMMIMTKRINRKYFNVKDEKNLNIDLEVTCYTCHSGKAHPPGIPIATAPQKEPVDSTNKAHH
ncbi:MAG: c-type cytochrome [Flavisolibacter sp.]|nr:c-type cytochrome [Flavisolibacter sp.]